MADPGINTIGIPELINQQYSPISSWNENSGKASRRAGDRDHLLIVGLNHNSAPSETRERVSISKEGLAGALSHLRGQVGNGVIISTCNRTEIYCTSRDPHQGILLSARFLSDYHGLDPEMLRPYLYFHADQETARHLFRVATGLDSMVLGESQILGQVRDAWAAASAPNLQAVPPILSGLFDGALRTGRRVQEAIATGRHALSTGRHALSTGRHALSIGRHALSIGGDAVRLAQQSVGCLEDKNILIIGAGEVGHVVGRALNELGAEPITIAKSHLRPRTRFGSAIGRKSGDND